MSVVSGLRGFGVAGLLLLHLATPPPRNLATKTNSHAATQHGINQFKANNPTSAAQSFATAHAIAPSAATAFNLGTAQVAAGDREKGSEALASAMRDPAFAADALYNRGTSALGAKAYDSAIRDFTSVLRLRPHDVPTKRNLEIALVRKQAEEDAKKRQGSGPGGQQPRPQPSQQQNAAQQQPKGDANTDAVLRSVQEQEKEELSRMHQRGAPAHVGW